MKTNKYNIIPVIALIWFIHLKSSNAQLEINLFGNSYKHSSSYPAKVAINPAARAVSLKVSEISAPSELPDPLESWMIQPSFNQSFKAPQAIYKMLIPKNEAPILPGSSISLLKLVSLDLLLGNNGVSHSEKELSPAYSGMTLLYRSAAIFTFNTLERTR